MKRLARRISVTELHDSKLTELRLMPQPIDRYSDEQIADGAIFLFAVGTNPELAVVLEASNQGWSYGFVRLSAAELTVSLDDKEVATIPGMDSLRRIGPYSSDGHLIEVPE